MLRSSSVRTAVIAPRSMSAMQQEKHRVMSALRRTLIQLERSSLVPISLSSLALSKMLSGREEYTGQKLALVQEETDQSIDVRCLLVLHSGSRNFSVTGRARS